MNWNNKTDPKIFKIDQIEEEANYDEDMKNSLNFHYSAALDLIQDKMSIQKRSNDHKKYHS